MKKLILLTSVAIMILGNISDSWAEENPAGTCGTNCNWVIEDGTLKITGSGAMTNYSDTKDGFYFNTSPWKDYDDLFTAVDVQGVSSIGYAAFAFLDNVTDVTIGDSVKNIGGWAFRNGHVASLVIPDSVADIGAFAFDLNDLSDITVPDSVTNIGQYAFASNPITSITIPDTITDITYVVLGNNLSRLNNLEIICKGNKESCASLSNSLKNYCYKPSTGKCEESMDLSGKVSLATEEQCNSEKYYYTGSSCEHRPENPADMVCTGGYAKLNNNCVDPLKTFAKKRWTPAEAAQWLKDDDNEITITFKK